MSDPTPTVDAAKRLLELHAEYPYADLRGLLREKTSLHLGGTALDLARAYLALTERVRELEAALERLEAANEAVAATRSIQTYLRMVDVDKAEPAMEALNDARFAARALKREGTQ
jgi:hypothetical protein